MYPASSDTIKNNLQTLKELLRYSNKMRKEFEARLKHGQLKSEIKEELPLPITPIDLEPLSTPPRESLSFLSLFFILMAIVGGCQLVLQYLKDWF